MSILQGIAVAVIVLVGLSIMAVIATENARRRREKLRRRFGPEYDRAVIQFGSIAKAEQELSSRARRLQGLELRDLSEADRMQFGHAWTVVQAKFVDSPSEAVHEANRLSETVMQARGYPVEDLQRRAADLSVEHANVAAHYRAARELAQANREGNVNTEELRQAFVHYRALFTSLLQEPRSAQHPNMRHARA